MRCMRISINMPVFPQRPVASEPLTHPVQSPVWENYSFYVDQLNFDLSWLGSTDETHANPFVIMLTIIPFCMRACISWGVHVFFYLPVLVRVDFFQSPLFLFYFYVLLKFGRMFISRYVCYCDCSNTVNLQFRNFGTTYLMGLSKKCFLKFLKNVFAELLPLFYISLRFLCKFAVWQRDIIW